jgi:hypothetical protein
MAGALAVEVAVLSLKVTRRELTPRDSPLDTLSSKGVES